MLLLLLSWHWVAFLCGWFSCCTLFVGLSIGLDSRLLLFLPFLLTMTRRIRRKWTSSKDTERGQRAKGSKGQGEKNCRGIVCGSARQLYAKTTPKKHGGMVGWMCIRYFSKYTPPGLTPRFLPPSLSNTLTLFDPVSPILSLSLASLTHSPTYFHSCIPLHKNQLWYVGWCCCCLCCVALQCVWRERRDGRRDVKITKGER